MFAWLLGSSKVAEKKDDLPIEKFAQFQHFVKQKALSDWVLRSFQTDINTINDKTSQPLIDFLSIRMLYVLANDLRHQRMGWCGSGQNIEEITAKPVETSNDLIKQYIDSIPENEKNHMRYLLEMVLANIKKAIRSGSDLILFSQFQIILQSMIEASKTANKAALSTAEETLIFKQKIKVLIQIADFTADELRYVKRITSGHDINPSSEPRKAERLVEKAEIKREDALSCLNELYSRSNSHREETVKIREQQEVLKAQEKAAEQARLEAEQAKLREARIAREAEQKKQNDEFAARILNNLMEAKASKDPDKVNDPSVVFTKSSYLSGLEEYLRKQEDLRNPKPSEPEIAAVPVAEKKQEIQTPSVSKSMAGWLSPKTPSSSVTAYKPTLRPGSSSIN